MISLKLTSVIDKAWSSGKSDKMHGEKVRRSGRSDREFLEHAKPDVENTRKERARRHYLGETLPCSGRHAIEYV